VRSGQCQVREEEAHRVGSKRKSKRERGRDEGGTKGHAKITGGKKPLAHEKTIREIANIMRKAAEKKKGKMKDHHSGTGWERKLEFFEGAKSQRRCCAWMLER